MWLTSTSRLGTPCAEASYYRCVFLSQYAGKNKISHPRFVYLREDQILRRLDGGLARSSALAQCRLPSGNSKMPRTALRRLPTRAPR
jgi:hypothetical protein